MTVKQQQIELSTANAVFFGNDGYFAEILGFLKPLLDARQVDSLPICEDHWDASSGTGTIPYVVLVAAKSATVLDLIQKIKVKWHTTPVIACVEEYDADVVPELLLKGVDDFIVWPQDRDTLMARTSARIDAFAIKSRESIRHVGSLVVNLTHRSVSNGRETSYLTPIETKIVMTLADQPGAVIGRSTMKQLCWGDTSITDNALNRKIYEVRRTLKKLSPSINIRTIYGEGFELDLDDKSANNQ